MEIYLGYIIIYIYNVINCANIKIMNIIIPIPNANFELVEIINNTPHCSIHGAMNKVSTHENGGGYWRCITVVSDTKEGVCRAGCEQLKQEL
jgi:hypothetical protein